MGALHVTPQSIASCLKEFWDGVSAPSQVGVRRLQSYLSSHINFEKMRKVLPLLLKTADRSLIHRALDLQKDGPSPGLDGVAPKVYRTFEDFFVPLMVYRTFEDFFVPLMEMTYKHLWGGGGLLPSWSMGVQVSVPKAGLSNSV